jgi:hypothetical protein
MELANDLGTPRDMICPAKDGEDHRIFAMRILTVEGIYYPKDMKVHVAVVGQTYLLCTFYFKIVFLEKNHYC